MTSISLSPGDADALLFDIGRVVLDIDFDKAVECWAAHAGRTPSDIAARFVRGETYRHHEAGKISDADYFDSLRTALGVQLTDEQFLEGWNAIFAGEMPDIARLLRRAAEKMPLYAFSNTNRAHVEYFSKTYAGLLGHFRELYLSSTIGLRKPDAAAYDHVVAAIGVPARASCSSTISPRISRAPGPMASRPFTSDRPTISPTRLQRLESRARS